MICYKDRTFCRYHMLCKNGHTCDRALTSKVIECAKVTGLPICHFSEFPECFVRWFDSEEKTQDI